MILKGSLSEVLVNIHPRINMKYVLLENVVKVIYVKLQKALYGLLYRALLFHTKLSTGLKIMFLS